MCSVEDCVASVHSRGFCQKHYRLFQKYGKPEKMPLEDRKPPGRKPEPEKWRSRHNPGNPTRNKIPKTNRKMGSSTHCGRGHELTEENSYTFRSSDREGDRIGCKKCLQNYTRKHAGKPLRPDDEPVGPSNTHKTHCPEGHEYSDANTGIDPKTGNRLCRPCRTKNAKIWSLKTLYGLTFEQFEMMQDQQEGKCWICHTGFSEVLLPHVDHDHATGEVRGLLCFFCNFGLGNFKDNVEALLRAVEYLQKPHTLP